MTHNIDLAAIRSYCLSKPKSYEDRPFGEHPVCIKVNGKIFAQIYPDKITLKCTRFQGELFRQSYPGIVVRGYHCPPVQQPYWNTIDLARLPAEELTCMIDLAYEAVLSGFPKWLQQNILNDHQRDS